jgi:hypothetical protein
VWVLQEYIYIFSILPSRDGWRGKKEKEWVSNPPIETDVTPIGLMTVRNSIRTIATNDSLVYREISPLYFFFFPFHTLNHPYRLRRVLPWLGCVQWNATALLFLCVCPDVGTYIAEYSYSFAAAPSSIGASCWIISLSLCSPWETLFFF